MAWVRIDDQFYEHPKLVQAGPLGLAMQVAALCYCNRYLTDGFVPRGAAKKLLDFDGLAMNMWDNGMVGGGSDATWDLVVAELEKAGLWRAADGGWVIHDYLKYQPSRASVETERQKTAERVKKHRNGTCNAVTPPVSNGVGNGESNDSCNAPVTGAPNPSPNPNKKESAPDGADSAESRRGGKSAIELKTYCEQCSADGVDEIAADDPVFAYAESIGLKVEYLELAWLVFRDKLWTGKRQKSWPQTFANYVKGNYLKLWYQADGGWALTTAGKQAQLAYGRRAA